MTTVENGHPPELSARPAELVARARELAGLGGRRILGITGPPACGKSTLAARLADALAGDATLVAMDGFHLANRELERLGRRDRKGAYDTFDARGYIALLRRLRDPDEQDLIYAPEFRREIEEPIACAVPVAADAPLIITEGNYLLSQEGRWGPVAELLDEVWYLEPSEHERIRRLVARHLAFGKSADEAREWALGSDQRNAELIAKSRDLADLVIRINQDD